MDNVNENPMDPLKEFVNDYKKVEAKYADVNNVADVAIESQKNKKEFASQNEDYVRLVRKMIDLDNPKRNFIRQIEETKKEIEILKSGYKVGDNDKQLLELNKKLSDLEEGLAGLEAEELITTAELDPLDAKKRQLDIEAQVLEDKGADLLNKKEIQN